MSFYSGMNESLKKAPQSQSMGSTEDYESDQLAEQKRGEELLDSLVDDKAANIEAPASSSLSNTISTATASSTSSVTSSLIGQSATTPTIGQTAPASTDNKKSPVREAAKVSASSGIGFNFAKPATSPVSSPTVSVTQTTSASAPTGVLAALDGMTSSASSSVAGSAPSTTSSSGTSSVGGFTFGAKNPASSPLTAPSNPGPNSTVTGTSTAATFTFSAASPPKSTVTSGFSLGSSALASTAAFNLSVVSGFATTQPQSSLTTSTSSSAPTGFTVPSAFAAPSAGGFTFGQALSAASGTEPPKTTSGSTVSPAAPTFNFGAAASSTSGSSNPASTSSNFAFGQVSKPVTAPASAGFNFGGSSNTPTTSAAFTSISSAVFGFGASNPPTNTTATGNTSSAFTFSGTTTSTASGSTPSSNNFNFGGTSAPSFDAPATTKIGGFSFNPGANTTTSSSMAPAASFGQAPASSSLSNTISTATASSTSSVTSSLIGQSVTTPTIAQTAPASTDNKKSPVSEAAKVSASSGIGFNFAKPATSPVSSPTVSVTQTTSSSAPTGVLAALAGMTSSASVQPPPPGIKGEVTKMAVPPHESRVLATASEGDSESSYETDTESESESEEEGIRPTGYKSDHSMGKSSWDALEEASEKQLKESKGAKLDKSADMETSASSSVAGSAPSTTSSSGTSSVGGFTFGAKNPASSPLTAPSNPGPNSTGTGTSTAVTFTFSAASQPKSTVTSCFSLGSSALASTAASNLSVVSGFATTQPQSSLTTSTSSSTSAPTGFTVPSAFAAPSAGGFTFGQALSAASGTEPPKTTSGSTVSPAAPTFNFGAAASSTSGSSNPASTSSNFAFGQVSKPVTAPASAGFNFGGSSNTPTTSAAFTSTSSAVFGFGASNPPTNTTATGNTSSAFTFSGTTTSTASGSTPSSNNFNFGGTSAPSFGAPATTKIGGFSFNPGATTTTSSSMAPAASLGQAIMSDQGATAFPVQTMVECGICGGTFNVDWFCKNCGGSICDTCYQAHQRGSLFRNHIVVPRTVEVLRLHGPAKIAEICRIHPTKEISTYCNDCKIPCCVLCQTEKHQRHAFSPIENKYLSAEESLDQYARDLQTDVKPSLDALKDSLKHRLKKHDEQIEKEKDEINTLRHTLKQKVDESCDLLLKELDQAKQDFRDFEKEIDSSKQRLDQLIKDLEIMIGEGKLDIIEYSPPSRKSLIPASPLPVLKVAKFVPGSDLIGLIQNKIGRIEFHDQISDNEETNASSNTALDIDISEQKSLIQVKGIDKADIKVTNVKSFKSKIGVSSLTSAGNNSAWVMYDGFYYNTMYLYDSNDHVVRSVKVENSRGIHDMVITRSGDMIVTCETVKRVSVGGEVSTLINTGNNYPTGVCLTDKEEIVVCMCGGHVAVYSPDGRSKLRQIRGVDSQGKPQIKSPYRVVCNGKDLCVVNKNICRNVVCVDEGDNVKWVYDGNQDNLGMSFDPRGICVDKYHNLLVSDYNNNCVHYVDREGGLIQVIITQEQTGLWELCGICVDDETGQVWVGNPDGDVAIAKLDIIEYSPPTRKSLIPASPLPVLTVPKFVPGSDLIGLIQKKIGRIEFHDQISDNEETNASSNTALDIDISEQKSLIQVKGIDKADIKVTKVKSFKSKIGVSSLTSAGNNSAWVMCYDTMYLYESNGHVVRSVKVENSRSIHDMVITRSGDMIVTCLDITVRRLSVDGDVSTLINPREYTPEGVCLTDKEEIVVCMFMLGGGHVAVYSPDGRSKLRKIRGMNSQGRPQITHPHRVVCNGKDLCVVCYSNVVCVDESDNVRWVYDGNQGNLRLSFYPRGICVDKYHNLLVSDKNNDCVHYIDREGGLIQVIMTQEQTGLWELCGICVDDETGQVWVGNPDGDVSDVVIAKYLK